MKKKIMAAILCIAVCLSSVAILASCKKKDKDALVIMTENLDGLFNPFFSTSANDSTIVSMTQIGMLSSKYENGEIQVAYGQNEATATLDFESKRDAVADTTTYTFVLKNGIKFSDGEALTMEDVLFNLYVYLDPVYTGSATIYSTDIQGLAAYRYQQQGLNVGDKGDENLINATAAQNAENRVMSLVQLYWATNKTINGQGASTNNVTYQQMVDAIKASNLTQDYLDAVAPESEQASVTTDSLLADYELALKYFKEELENDYNSAKDSYTDEPYKSHKEFKDEVFCFMFTEGYITPKYAKIEGTDKDDKSKILDFEYNYNEEAIETKEQAIEKVYTDTVTNKLDQILLLWGTAAKLNTEFTAKAKEVLLQSKKNSDGSLIVPNISGIVSLGHTTETKTVTVNGNTYNVASEHNADGTPKNAGEHDVLQITINGVDPKAVWNFAFSVAPQHYYGKGSAVGVDIKNNQFGVVWSDFDYMRDILQSTTNNKLPMGAGPYQVTNRKNENNPTANDFFSNNIVYFKANTNFETVGTGINNAKIEKIRYQVVSASNAIAALEEGSVDYITPQYSKDNYEKIGKLTKKHYESLLTDQLGYGYIGINASKVTDINIRRAIMAAMNTSLAIDYYAAGTASNISWPMSKVSWAYPYADASKTGDLPNGKTYIQTGKFDEAAATKTIQDLMAKAGASAGDSRLKMKFTIAGSNLQDHPSYKVFRDAADLLNSLGWDITVEPDTQALTKLSTGSLTVWAAAWGSSLDPDMYQVYHKNSSATSTLAWGYNHLNGSGASDEEKQLLNLLSEKIDLARETEDRATRSALYKDAMSYVLDLAVELPVYQRSTVYVYNTDIIDPESVPNDINPYSSPLDRIWEIELAK